jgi:hypothetical protein
LPRGVEAFRETETHDMKHPIRTLAALLAAMAVVACGGKQTMASKSAAAYDEAKKKDIPIEAGEHGGHSAEPAAAVMTATEMAAMPGMAHSAMAGMDHSRMPGMKHDSSATAMHDMAGMDHSAMPGMEHGSMTGMQHSGSMPGMQRESQPAAPIAIPPPTSNAAISQAQPATTLRPDEFDTPAPTAIEEAAKGATGMSHDHKPPPSEHHHGEAS